MKPVIRLATAADLPAINAIYNHYVATSHVRTSTNRNRKKEGRHGSPLTARSIP